MVSPLDLVPRRFMAAQLRKPSGLFGRFFIAPALNRSNTATNRLVLESLQLGPDDQVLEVGFGGGDLIARMLPALPHGRVWGADFSSDMVAFCAKRFGPEITAGAVTLLRASIEDLPFPPASFAKACTVNTVYFWQQPEAAASELSRVLTSGGRLVVGFSPPATLQQMPVTRHCFRYVEAGELEELLARAGFTSIETREAEEPEGNILCTVAVKPALQP